MSPRVVALATLASADHPRVLGFARALVERGDRVTLLAPGEGELPPPNGVELVRIGRPLSPRPGLGETLRCFTALGLRVAALHLRRRFDVMLFHGGEEAVALMGAIPRLTGTRLVLDLDAEGDRAAGLVAAVAGIVRSPALRLVDGVIASDAIAEARLREVGLKSVETVEMRPRVDDYPRRDKQPRLTVKSPVRVACVLGPRGRSKALEALVLAHLEDGRLQFDIEGLDRGAVASFAERHAVIARPSPQRSRRQWLDRMHDAVVALIVDAHLDDVLPFLAVGIPVVVVARPDLQVAFTGGEVTFVEGSDPELISAGLIRAIRSSRDRRERIRKGWAWIEAHGWAGQARKFFMALDGPEDGRRPPRQLPRR